MFIINIEKLFEKDQKILNHQYFLLYLLKDLKVCLEINNNFSWQNDQINVKGNFIVDL